MPDLSFTSSAPGAWREKPEHRAWLNGQANILFDLFDPVAINPAGGFFDLDSAGQPLASDNPVRPIHTTARAVHCYVIGSLLGRPGSDRMVDHGMRYLWERHRDAQHGGYVWSLDDDGPKDATKQGYGHAFVLLAASSARLVGHPLAEQMLADVTELLNTRFWEDQHGAITEEFERDWTPMRGYRGQNSNMHLTEALMAAFEATGERAYLDKAERIADLIINRRARDCGFRVAEHFDEQWTVDRDYKAVNEMFRPSGTTPGHWLEWSRLILQLWVLGGKNHDWMPRRRRGAFPRSRSNSAGIATRAASSTRSIGPTSPPFVSNPGGPLPRRPARRPSWWNIGRARSMKNGTGASGTPSPTTTLTAEMAAGSRSWTKDLRPSHRCFPARRTSTMPCRPA